MLSPIPIILLFIKLYAIKKQNTNLQEGGAPIATTRIIPLHASAGKSISHSITDILDYGKNPAKTEQGQLVSTFECSVERCNDEFLVKKQIYAQITGRAEKQNKSNVIAYQIRQSFSPDDNATPEQANVIGMELANEFTGGNHQLVVCTHNDKNHLHNHIYWNSTTLDCSGKFDNVKDSAMLVRQLSDKLCYEYGLSVVEQPSEKGVSYDVWQDKQKGIDWKQLFKNDLDSALANSKTLVEFNKNLKDKGYTLRGKNNLSLKHPDRKQAMRTDRVDNKLDYSLAGIEYALKNHGRLLPKTKKIDLEASHKTNLLVELEGKTGGLKIWAEKQNLQELTKAYNYLKIHNIATMAGLAGKLELLTNNFQDSSSSIKTIEAEIDKTKVLKTHIINYAKTSIAYKSYQKSRHKEEFYDDHSADILIHEASRQAFKTLGVRSLPKVAELNANLQTLYAKKAEVYTQYKSQRSQLKELQTVKKNLDSFLGANKKKEKENEQII